MHTMHAGRLRLYVFHIPTTFTTPEISIHQSILLKDIEKILLFILLCTDFIYFNVKSYLECDLPEAERGEKVTSNS